jgi:hypothetical protein
MNGMSEAHTEIVPNTSAKRDPSADLEDELRPEYDASMLKNGVRGKYFALYRKLPTTYEHREKTNQHT